MAEAFKTENNETLIVLDDEEVEILFEILWCHVEVNVLKDLCKKLVTIRGTDDVTQYRLTECDDHPSFRKSYLKNLLDKQ